MPPKQNWRMSTSHVILGADNDPGRAIDTQDTPQVVSLYAGICANVREDAT
jgi:hypothetical protein